jgi:capsular exopolysaccharide synthesis family protein
VGLAQADSQLVSAAPTPTSPSSPKLLLNLALGLGLAGMAGFAAAGLAEMRENGLATSADVEKRLNLRYLGAVPLLSSTDAPAHANPIDYVIDHPLSSFSESFRGIVAAILHGAGCEHIKTVAVTSTMPAEGKTTTAICMARAAALQGYRVVLVDCDLRRASLDRIVAEQPAFGLLEVLSGAADLDQALVADARSAVDILPLVGRRLSTADVFGSPSMDRLLAELKRRYDLVVLDTAPVAPVADTRVLARKADFVAVVARWRMTPYQGIQSALQLLSGNGVEVGGMVLNQVDIAQQMRHGYGDLAYYFSNYKSYYLESQARECA